MIISRYTNWKLANKIAHDQQVWNTRQFVNKVATVVLDVVHPGNLEPLPPTPQRIMDKAEQLGLISSREYLDHCVWH